LDRDFKVYAPTVGVEDASDEESIGSGRGSDLDAKLEGYDDMASNYNSEDFDHAPKLSSLLLLDKRCC
jgi:hypothetical protein